MAFFSFLVLQPDRTTLSPVTNMLRVIIGDLKEEGYGGRKGECVEKAVFRINTSYYRIAW